MKKKLFLLLAVLLLLIGIAPSIAYAEEPVSDEACLMYADSAWGACQYWNDGNEYAPKATNATVNGPGEYTVGLDFTGTDEGVASGLGFAGVQILNGETNFPGYCITIKDIKVNGESIEFTKGYTSSDNGTETRMNIYNEWVSELPKDARSSDWVTEDANWIIVDKEAFASVETVEVTFDYSMPAAKAYIMYADTGWGACQYWCKPENIEAGVVPTDVTVTGEGSYKIGLDFTGTADGAAPDVGFTAIGIKGGEVLYPGWFIRIDSMKVNGEDVAYTKGYTSSDDGKETRMNIYNEWVSELPADARSFDGSTEDANWIIVDKEAFVSVETFEIEFTYISGEAPEPTEAPEIDVEAALAADYNAYFGIQTENYIFRNQWNEANYGMETANWTHLTGWDADNNEVDYGGTFTDDVIEGNGTYTVGVTLGDMGLGEDTMLHMLFVSTDIPSKLVDDGLVTISDVKTSFDGGKGQTAFYANTKGDYLEIDILNEYESAVGAEAIPYTMPTTDIMITFTVDGFSNPAQAEEPSAAPEATEASADTSSSPLSTGVIIAIAAGAVVIIGGIIILLVVSRKKKKTS